MSQREDEHTWWECMQCGHVGMEEDLGCIEQEWICPECQGKRWVICGELDK